MSERDEELEALRDEVRYLRASRDTARKCAEAARTRSMDVGKPRVDVRLVNAYYRIYVNDAYIDGQETAEVAETIANRLRKAFVVPT